MSENNTLVDQPTPRTARKVRNAAWSAAWVAPFSTVAAGLITEIGLPQMEAYHAQIDMLIVMVVTGVATWIAGYYSLERRENVVVS